MSPGFLSDPEVMHLSVLIAFESCLIAFLVRTGDCVSNFAARKACHAGTGLILLQLDSRIMLNRWFVYLFGVVSLAITWEFAGCPRFRWGRPADVGMTVYCIVATFWFYMEMPVFVLAPMFFADPAGAIVGRQLSSMKDKGVVNPVWWNMGGVTKTVGGSAAVLFFTAVTFAGPATLPQRLAVGVAAVLAEALGGAYDNLLLVICVVGSRCLFNYLEFDTISLWAGEENSLRFVPGLLPAFADQSTAFLNPW